MNEIIKLSRDCEAVQIPLGTAIVLPAGSAVSIVQSLGGNYTVHAPEGLFRIAAHDADALGAERTTSLMEEVCRRPEAAGPADEAQLWTALKGCFDPEIPVNIVDLGLVYDLHLETLPSGSSDVRVKMTLTAPGCGMGSVIAADARQRLLYVAGVEEATVDIVWDPPWHQSMITAEGRKILGLD
jgi:probable FeS assembly SUF system protein SufT